MTLAHPPIHLPIECLFLLYQLQKNGFEAYLVGGAVRDVLRATHESVSTAPDFDLTTNATPPHILKLFPESFYENNFGTVMFPAAHAQEMLVKNNPESVALFAKAQQTDTTTSPIIDIQTASKIHISLQKPELPSNSEKLVSTQNFEITTYRSDGVYSDHRRPETVTWGKTIEEDLSRRDFTINALAISVATQTLSDLFEDKKVAFAPTIEIADYTLIDLFDGLQDLENHLIRTVGEPAQRFSEDALRMLRAIRFSVQLNMKMTDEVFTAISGLAADIQHVSWERIRDEFMKMLSSDFPAEAIELLDETGLLHFLIPELREGKGVEQAGHHTTDVWTHSIDALRECPSKNPVVRLATLLHDIAKPRTFKLDEITHKPTFYNHEVVGARLAKDIAKRLRLSKHDCDRIFTLVRHHMFYYQPTMTDAAIRRFMRKVGLENINDILELREGDRLGSGARRTSWRLEEMKERMTEQLNQPFAVTDLAIDGNDLMSELSLQPSRQIGDILQFLFEKVLDQPELNQKETLLEHARAFIIKKQDQ